MSDLIGTDNWTPLRLVFSVSLLTKRRRCETKITLESIFHSRILMMCCSPTTWDEMYTFLFLFFSPFGTLFSAMAQLIYSQSIGSINTYLSCTLLWSKVKVKIALIFLFIQLSNELDTTTVSSFSYVLVAQMFICGQNMKIIYRNWFSFILFKKCYYDSNSFTQCLVRLIRFYIYFCLLGFFIKGKNPVFPEPVHATVS